MKLVRSQAMDIREAFAFTSWEGEDMRRQVKRDRTGWGGLRTSVNGKRSNREMRTSTPLRSYPEEPCGMMEE